MNAILLTEFSIFVKTGNDCKKVMMERGFLSYLKHLTAEAFQLLIWSYDTILVDEARRT